MDFRIRGISFPITPPDILKATRNVPPDPVDARNKYFVTLHEQPYPIKQVLRLVTGLPSLGFTLGGHPNPAISGQLKTGHFG